MRRNANENNVLNIKAEAERLSMLGYTKSDFADGGNYYLPEELRGTYSWEDGEMIFNELPAFPATMEGLADLINWSCEYNNDYIEVTCEQNGWIIDEDEWHICHNETHQLVFNDRMVAVVEEL